MKCPYCVEEGERSRVYEHGGRATLMATQAFYDEDGVRHFHDPNKHTNSYSCSRGHRWSVIIRPGCPADGCREAVYETVQSGRGGTHADPR